MKPTPETQRGVAPKDTRELVRLLAECAAQGTALVPAGGQTGLMGPPQSFRESLRLDLGAFNDIRINESALLVQCGAGVSGRELHAALARAGCCLGHYPQSPAGATVGGWVSTASVGIGASRYGGIRRMLAGLVVNCPGAGEVRTGVFGKGGEFDCLSGLFCGAEGTLGVISRVAFHLRELPELRRLQAFELPSLTAGIGLVRELSSKDCAPAFIYLLDPVAWLTRRLRNPRNPLAGGLSIGRLGLAALDAAGGLVGVLAGADSKVLLVAGDEGSLDDVAASLDEIAFLVERYGGEELGRVQEAVPAREPCAVLPEVVLPGPTGAAGYFDLSVSWDRVIPVYERLRRKGGQGHEVVFMHPGRNGCCLLVRQDGPGAKNLAEEWGGGLFAAIGNELGVSGNHYLGIGTRKRLLLERRQDGAGELASALKQVFDPAGVMNPGRFWRDIDSRAAKGGKLLAAQRKGLAGTEALLRDLLAIMPSYGVSRCGSCFRVSPETEMQLGQILLLARLRGLSVQMTGRWFPEPTATLRVSTERLGKIVEFNQAAGHVLVQAGVSLEELSEFLAARNTMLGFRYQAEELSLLEALLNPALLSWDEVHGHPWTQVLSLWALLPDGARIDGATAPVDPFPYDWKHLVLAAAGRIAIPHTVALQVFDLLQTRHSEEPPAAAAGSARRRVHSGTLRRGEHRIGGQHLTRAGVIRGLGQALDPEGLLGALQAADSSPPA